MAGLGLCVIPLWNLWLSLVLVFALFLPLVTYPLAIPPTDMAFKSINQAPFLSSKLSLSMIDRNQTDLDALFNDVRLPKASESKLGVTNIINSGSFPFDVSASVASTDTNGLNHQEARILRSLPSTTLPDPSSLSIPPLKPQALVSLNAFSNFEEGESNHSEEEEPLPETIPTYAWNASISNTIPFNTSSLLNNTILNINNTDVNATSSSDPSAEGTQANITPWMLISNHDFSKGVDPKVWTVVNQCDQDSVACYTNSSGTVTSQKGRLVIRPISLNTQTRFSHTYLAGKVTHAFNLPLSATDVKWVVDVALPTHSDAVPILKLKLGDTHVVFLFPYAVVASEELQVSPSTPSLMNTNFNRLQVRMDLVSGLIQFGDPIETQLMIKFPTLSHQNILDTELSFSVLLKPSNFFSEEAKHVRRSLVNEGKTNLTHHGVLNNTDPSFSMRIRKVSVFAKTS